jgi:hypothetical protein
MINAKKILNEINNMKATAQMLFDQATRLEKELAGVHPATAARKGEPTQAQLNKVLMRRRRTKMNQS